MWKKLYEITHLIFNLGKDLQQNRADLKDVQAEVRELGAATQDELHKLREAIQRLAYEVQRAYENEAHEREKLELRLELQKLRASKELPPAQSNDQV